MQALNRANPATCRKAQASTNISTPTSLSIPRLHCNTQTCIQLGSHLTASTSARCTIVARSKLGDVSLFGGDTASLLGGSSVEETKSKPNVDDVPLESEVNSRGTWFQVDSFHPPFLVVLNNTFFLIHKSGYQSYPSSELRRSGWYGLYCTP